MEIQAFGYLGIGSSKLDDWASFAADGLGMQVVDRCASVRAFRMDDRKQRLVVDSAMPEGTQYFGWEVATAAALDALAARLEAAGIPVKRESAALTDQRHVAGMISFADPAGNRLDRLRQLQHVRERDTGGFVAGGADGGGLAVEADEFAGDVLAGEGLKISAGGQGEGGEESGRGRHAVSRNG